MADTNHARQKEVKVEDLLRIKRAERPDDAFWNSFDRELHQRMLQTLVKKDPWYVQVLRGVTGRIAQTTAVGAAAALLAMMVVRPALVEVVEPIQTPALASSAGQSAENISSQAVSSRQPREVAMSDLDTGLTPDYRMEAISASNATSDLGYTPDYAHDSIEVAGYDSAAYVTDTASFAGSGLATGLVY